MELIAKIRAEARRNLKTIVFPEGEDPRVIAAAKTLEREGLAKPVLVNRKMIAKDLERYAELFYERRRHKGVDMERARMEASDPIPRPSRSRSPRCASRSTASTGPTSSSTPSWESATPP